jgi:hypothetical protein
MTSGEAMLPTELLAVVSDQGLTDAARVIAVRLFDMGDDWHELSPDDFSRMVAGYPQRDTVRKHLRQLEMAGYVDRRAGGRGHSDSFRFAFSVGAESQPILPESQPKLDSVGAESDSKPRSSSKEKEVVVNPPIVPPSLSESAGDALDQHDDLLAGCRGALADYLRANVPPPRQQPYVQSLATYLNGFGFQWRNADGEAVPKEARTGLLAAALNELGAQDEAGMKNPVGDVRNLRTKLGILARDYGRKNGGPHNGGTGTEGSGQAAGRRTGTDDYDHLGG